MTCNYQLINRYYSYLMMVKTAFELQAQNIFVETAMTNSFHICYLFVRTTQKSLNSIETTDDGPIACFYTRIPKFL